MECLNETPGFFYYLPFIWIFICTIEKNIYVIGKDENNN